MNTSIYSFTELDKHSDIHVKSISSYLQFLVDGDGKRAHCPFTKSVLMKKMFYYDISKSIISYEEFCSALKQMKLFIHSMNDKLAVVGLVYSNKENYTLETAIQVEKYRQKHRLELISNGLTIAWIHPENKLGTHTNKNKPHLPLWISEVPILTVRNLHKGDKSFMVTPESKEAFALGMEKVKNKFKPIDWDFFTEYWKNFGI